ncbi:MAG TPA: TauD/TfdA family dioxygenase, partial [Verrucomicrobiota bacterium]|nr:TauD/TfdA family dioxygenase [Verrucomicrobiota bacterium]
VWTPPVPVLWRAAGEWEVGLPTYNCRPADAADTVAAEALAALKRLLGEERFRVPVVVEKGVALIFANNRGLHGRAGYEGERLLLRTYIRRSLDTLRAKSGEPGPVFDAWDLLR